jgi:broad specificity phosphatase PhoE
VTTIILARHGETDWNRERRWQGQSDPPLNELGREQSRRLADALADVPLAAVYSSDLQRAVETATIVARRKGLPLAAVPELREIDIGEWSGLTSEEIESRYPQNFRRLELTGRGWERGESYEQLGRRVLAAVERIAAAHAGEQVLVIGHGGAIRSVLAHAEGVDYLEHRRRSGGPLENCALCRIAVEDGYVRRID